ncbi:MAG: hypothetical protein R8M38_06405 [Mariprofundaceae bacterium]
MIKADGVVLPKLAEIVDKGTQKLKLIRGDLDKLSSKKWDAGSIVSIKSGRMEIQFKAGQVITEAGKNMRMGEEVLLRKAGNKHEPHLELRLSPKNLSGKKVDSENKKLSFLSKPTIEKSVLHTQNDKGEQSKLTTKHGQMDKQEPNTTMHHRKKASINLSDKFAQLFGRTPMSKPSASEQQVRLLSSHTTSLRSPAGVIGKVELITPKKIVVALENSHKSIERISLSAAPDVKIGDHVQLRLSNKTNIKPAETLVTMRKVENSSVKNPKSTAFTLHQKLIATVEKQLPDGQIILNAGGKPLQTAALKGVNVGDSLLLRVAALGPEPVLDVIEKSADVKSKALTLLRNQLPNSSGLPIAQTVQQLKQATAIMAGSPLPPHVVEAIVALDGWINNHMPDDDMRVIAERLTSLIKHGGQHLEAQLRDLAVNTKLSQNIDQQIDQDLKAIMLKISAAFQTPGIEALSQTADRALARIESQQAGNLLAQMHGEPLRIEFPLMIANEVITAKLSMQAESEQQQHDNQQQQEGSYNVLFLLDLQGIGQTRIDTKISTDFVKATFYHEEDRAATFVRKSLPALKEKLQSLGYEHVYLSSGAYRMITPEKQQEFQALAVGSATNLLDIVG